MLSFLLNDANFWYSCALGFVASLLLLEVIGMFFGLSILGLTDDPAPLYTDSATNVTALASWLALDKLPLMIWLVLLCTCFGLIGLTFNFLSLSILASYTTQWTVMSLAVVLGLVLTKSLGGVLAHLLPKQETSATREEDLVGTVGHITVGVGTPNNPAEGKFNDAFGQPHYVMVEPIESAEEFKQGDKVVLIQKQAQSWVATRYIDI